MIKKKFNANSIKKYLIKKRIYNNDDSKIIYKGELLKIFYGLDQLIKVFAINNGAEEEIYSSTLNLNTLLQTGYIKSFPQFVYFNCNSKNNFKNISNISKSKKNFIKNLSDPKEVLPPTVCHHFFESLQKKKISKEKFITSSNICNRFEPSGIKFFSRLNHYWMREFIFVGRYNKFKKKINESLNWFTNLLKEWRISFEIVVANDPFFRVEKWQTKLQKKFQLKKEILVKINKNEKISIASFNIHQNKIINSLKINNNKGFTSACIGFGFERIIFTLMINYGPNFNKWPNKIKKNLNLI